MVYLDYCATTPVSKELLDLYVDVSNNYIGNANSTHFLGEKSKELLKKARNDIAKQFKCYSGDIIFTSGASESNTTAIMGAIGSLKSKGKHIITSKLEHKSILELMKHLSLEGYDVDYVKINYDGIVDLIDLESKIRDDTILISICGVNSEVGFVQPLDKIREIIDKKKNFCFFHSDLTQVLGKIKIDLSYLDLASFSSHKVYAPIGCGILYKRSEIYINKYIYGTTTNSIFRGGTPALPLIVTFSKAIQIAENNLISNFNKCLKLKKILINGLSKYPIRINSNDLCVPHIINISLLSLSNKLFVKNLSDNGICVSINSACCSSYDESIVLNEVTNNDKDVSKTSIRISLSHLTSEEDINKFLNIFDEVWNKFKKYNKEVK